MLGIKRFKKSLSLSPGSKDAHLDDHYRKIPLTHRNIETFVEEQIIQDACNPVQRTREVQISEWLRLVPRVSASSRSFCPY
jgi:hypothetical protein